MVRSVLLKVHLCLGLPAAIFLIILGLTGSVMAFENDIDHWLHPELFYVKTGAQVLPEHELIPMVEKRFTAAHVASVQVFRRPDLARVLRTADGRSVFVNPYDGSILGNVQGSFAIDPIIGYIHQIHLRLVPVPRNGPQIAAIGKDRYQLCRLDFSI